MAELLLVTGQPGAGKSLYSITRGLQFLKEGRTVYAAGFKELNYEAAGFLPLPFDFGDWDPADKDDQGRPMAKWQTLENAVIILDECYNHIPQRGAGKPVPVHVDGLARHRHYNIDIILVTQKHDQIDSFVRGLVGTHIHVRNKFGFKAAVLKTWDAFQLNVEKKADSAPVWKYPKQNYALYKSATAHSVKRRVPWFLWAPIPLLLLIGLCVWYSMHAFGGSGGAVGDAHAAHAAPTRAATAAASKDVDDELRHRDYAKWMQPRVAGQPWTAPAYDQLQPQGVPDLFCIAVDDGRCECRTEQGTRYVVEAGVCRTIAREGIYNPFRKVADSRDMRGDDREPDRGGDRAEDQAVADVRTGTYWPKGGIPQAYAPPEHQIVTRGPQ